MCSVPYGKFIFTSWEVVITMSNHELRMHIGCAFAVFIHVTKVL